MFGIVRFEPLWMVARAARRRFMIFAACSLTLGIVLMLLRYQSKLFDEQAKSLAVSVVAVIAMIPAIVGGLCMFFGMAWYCLEVDTPRVVLRALLAFLMLSTFPFGQIVYYFLVYRPQTARVSMRII
jgi:hypothetical protein